MKKQIIFEKRLVAILIILGMIAILLHFIGPCFGKWAIIAGGALLLIGGTGWGDATSKKGRAFDITDLPKKTRLRIVAILPDGKTIAAHELDDKNEIITTDPYFIREVTLPTRLVAGCDCYIEGDDFGGRWIVY